MSWFDKYLVFDQIKDYYNKKKIKSRKLIDHKNEILGYEIIDSKCRYDKKEDKIYVDYKLKFNNLILKQHFKKSIDI